MRARNEHFEQRGLKTAAFHRKTFDDPATIQSVRMLGSDTGLKWKQTAAGLAITMSTMPATGHAYPVRIEFSGPIPAPARPE